MESHCKVAIRWGRPSKYGIMDGVGWAGLNAGQLASPGTSLWFLGRCMVGLGCDIVLLCMVLGSVGVPGHAVATSRLYGTAADTLIDDPNSVIVHPRTFPRCITPRRPAHLDRQGAGCVGGVPVRVGMWHGWCVRGTRVAQGMSVRGMARQWGP